MYRKILLFASFVLLLAHAVSASVLICTWNLKDFGKTKTDAELAFIANTIKHCDVVAIQEVVAGPGGAQAVARLVAQLGRTGAQWDYVVSEPTSSSAYKKERYAFLWKSRRVTKAGHARLEERYHLLIDREPFYIDLRCDSAVFTLATFHAITRSKQPETEVKYLRYIPGQESRYPLVFCGDFNLPSTHSVFGPLKKMGYTPVLVAQKTSLKMKCKGDDCLSAAFDNIFVPGRGIDVVQSGVIHFYKHFSMFEEARKISDHIPVFAELNLK